VVGEVGFRFLLGVDAKKDRRLKRLEFVAADAPVAVGARGGDLELRHDALLPIDATSQVPSGFAFDEKVLAVHDHERTTVLAVVGRFPGEGENEVLEMELGQSFLERRLRGGDGRQDERGKHEDGDSSHLDPPT
jgi:hypothetical protein